MILDKELLFGSDQAVTTTADATNTIDLRAAGDAIGQELTFHAFVAQQFVGCTSVQVVLKGCDTVSGSYVPYLTGRAVPLAELLAGKDLFCVRVPQGLPRYVKLGYTVVGTATAGKLTSFMNRDF